MQMDRTARVLCLTAGLLGLATFAFSLRAASDPLWPYLGWVLPFGIVCLIAGLTTGSLVTWRGRWR